MRHFVPIALVFATVAAYGEPIELGCSARGPLAALQSSSAFRKAIGGANPANYLGSVYDQNGTQLSPESFKTLRCPLFIDSSATPSASRSKAILNAEVGIVVAKQVVQTAATVEKQPLTVFSAAGVVAQLPTSELSGARSQERPQPAPKEKAALAAKAQVVLPSPELPLQSRQVAAEASQPAPAEPVAAASEPGGAPVEDYATPSYSADPVQDNWLLSLAQALRLIRQVQGSGGESAFVFNPAMVLVDFLALFMAILSFSLLVFHPGSPVAVVRSRVDVYRDALKRVEFQPRQPVLATSRSTRIVAVPEAGMLLTIGR